jgi:hypothetical protein
MLKTKKEILEELINEQTAVVLNREASMGMLEGMPADRVLAKILDQEKMTWRGITVQEKLKEITENLELDKARLKELNNLYKNNGDKR